MDRYRIEKIVRPYLEIITPYVNLERFLDDSVTRWYCKLPAEKRQRVLQSILRRMERQHQQFLVDAKKFVEDTWVKLLKILDQKLESGQIGLAEYYTKRDFYEAQLNASDALSIAENFERRKVG